MNFVMTLLTNQWFMTFLGALIGYLASNHTVKKSPSDTGLAKDYLDAFQHQLDSANERADKESTNADKLDERLDETMSQLTKAQDTINDLTKTNHELQQQIGSIKNGDADK